MRFKRKSQAAMEFLMTYGWALLVVLIVIAALAFFGLLNPNRFLPEKCEITPGITCLDFNAQTDDAAVSNGDVNDNITMLINNGIGQEMEGVLLNVTECTGAASNNISSIPQGQTQTFRIQCAGMTTNSKFKSDLELSYNTTVEGHEINHFKSGYLVVQVEGI